MLNKTEAEKITAELTAMIKESEDTTLKLELAKCLLSIKRLEANE